MRDILERLKSERRLAVLFFAGALLIIAAIQVLMPSAPSPAPTPPATESAAE